MSDRDVFLDALDRADPAHRAAFLDRACAGDPERRRRVEGLFAAHEAAGAFLRTPAPAADSTLAVTETVTPPDRDAPEIVAAASLAATADHAPHSNGTGPAGTRPLAERPGTTIGPYRLLQQIGEGGMGAVFLAEQERPVRRTVALKVIKAGMDTDQVIARFEAERQALAIMDHPNIARVLDAGATDSGRPFFVMELVRGLPITRYCDEARLPPRARLELMIPVCQAVQHAHQKGVIHRDIKPSNVLVAEVDGRPVPKVIDFGIAKATDQSLTERSLFTQLGAIVGTPEYMSPEQAGLGATDVDTRSDVYSLGVLLYELLTGSTPLERGRLREAGFAEVLRRIREEEPPTPSSRLSATREGLPSISAVRGLEPARLSRLVRGELDWVVMRALEKDRARRYETANALARDLQRYLADEPVEAGPPSASYRLRKFASKHRGAFVTAGGFAAVLLLAAGVSTWQAILARRAEAVAHREWLAARSAELATARALSETTEAKKATEAALTDTRRQRDRAEAISTLLTETFRKPDPAQDGSTVTVAELLDRAAARLGPTYTGPAETRAALLNALGLTYVGLGLYDRAVDLHQQAVAASEAVLGPDHVDTLTVRMNLGTSLQYLGRYDETIRLMEATAPRLEAALGPDHAATLSARLSLAAAYFSAGRRDESSRILEAILPRLEATLGLQDRRALVCRRNLGVARLEAGRTADAIPLLETTHRAYEALSGPDHFDTLSTGRNLADAYRQAGRIREAIAMHEAILGRFEAKLGRDHPQTLSALNSLSLDYDAAGRMADSLRLDELVVRHREAKLGPNHPDTLTARNNLGLSYAQAGRTADAIPLLEDTLRRRKLRLGADHPSTLITLGNLALAYEDADRLPEAIRILEESRSRLEAKLGADHPLTFRCLNNLATVYLGAGQAERAIGLLEPSVARLEVLVGADHPETLLQRANLASAYEAAGRTEEAIRLFEAVGARCEATLGADHPYSLKCRNGLAHAHRRAGRFEEAIATWRRLLPAVRKALGPANPKTTDTTLSLAETLVTVGRADEAEALFRELAGRLREAGRREGDLARTLAALGNLLLEQARWAEAEAPLRECVAVREAAAPDQWSLFLTRSALGAALAGQGRHAEAEPLLVSGYEGLKSRESSMPKSDRGSCLSSAAARIIRLYKAWGRPEQEAAWRARLGADLPAAADPDAGFPRNPFASPR